MFGPEDFVENEIKMQQEVPGTQVTAEVPAQSERFGDFIVRYEQGCREMAENIPGNSFQSISDIFGVIYVPLDQIPEIEVKAYTYRAIPKCYTYMDVESLNASGVTRLHNHPYLQLRGKGTAVAVIDSGIDYRNPVFWNGAGSRIAYIWDQTLAGGGEERVPYGRLFTKEDIDQALAAENPLEVVPSTDTNGHGTMLAAIAAGNFVPQEGFSGAAPEASLIIVKVKPAKQYLREFYLFPPDAELFQEDDIMLAMAYSILLAREQEMPLSFCLGLGTNQGGHNGQSPLSKYVDYIAGISKLSVSVAAGNEGAARHHYGGNFNGRNEMASVDLRVAENEESFTMEFWGTAPDIYTLSIQAPTGETLDISSSLGAVTQELSFVFVETKVLVNYIAIERQSGNTLVYFRFLQPASGIWRIFVRGREQQNGSFHMWLPVEGLISQDTFFLESSPYNTVTSPGDSTESITVTAYQYRDNSLYVNASRGFMPNGEETPQIAAPGAGIRVPLLNGRFGIASGTSLAVAQTAGVAALLFEWAVIRGNQPYFSGSSVKYYLERGARREDRMQYPNPDWGYGRLDLYHTFELLT